MPRSLELTGMRFGRLIAYERAPSKNGRARWNCKCDCGQSKIVTAGDLGRMTRSCGCLRSEWYITNNKARAIHGKADTPEHRAWVHARHRCHNPKDKSYRNYGARGITMCPEWRDDFTVFFNHVGPRPSPKHSIDRIDNNGNYEPGNVRWVTSSEQQRNRRKWTRHGR